MTSLLQQDADRILAYHTKQEVNIKDRALGLTNIFLQLLIVSYIVGYVFVVKRGYLEYEQARGAVATHVSGDIVSIFGGSDVHRYFGPSELSYPPLENGNVFIATKYMSTPQVRGICVDKESKCKDVAEDCGKNVGATCVNGKCMEPGWCPDTDKQEEVFKLPTEEVLIWVKSAIQFYRLNLVAKSDKVYMNDHTQPIVYPAENANTFPVRDLLLLCSPPVRFEEISELGAVVEVQIVWNCNVGTDTKNCKPIMNARRVDALFDEHHIGYQFHHAEYHGDEKRDLITVRGVRFYFRTVGTGRLMSLTAIQMSITTGLALLGFAPIFTDLLMVRCFRSSKKYEARKYQQSADFSEVFDDMAMQEEDEELSSDSDEEEEEEEEEDEQQ
mmetsp:Transcript_9879/g.21712  ORF Transcript_9879/g.21712 Transcript_9879/m.21712 type:complete len:386 (-) Transcript_9879:75-1232(-)